MDYTNSQIKNLIEEHIHNARNRDILLDRFVDGLTFEEIAEKHDMSVRQCQYIVYRAQEKLIKYLS